MALDAHTIARRWFDEVWNQGREEVVDELFAEDSVAHGLGEGAATVRGPEEFKMFFRTMKGALPDVQIKVEDLFATDEHARIRVTLHGTHLGEGLGLKPTGRRVAVSGIVIIKVRDGKVVEGWNCWDQLGFLKQLGALPEPGGGDRFLGR
jgi:steroid delta-isomerase-like uncharacterized protein